MIQDCRVVCPIISGEQRLLANGFLFLYNIQVYSECCFVRKMLPTVGGAL